MIFQTDEMKVDGTDEVTASQINSRTIFRKLMDSLRTAFGRNHRGKSLEGHENALVQQT